MPLLTGAPFVAIFAIALVLAGAPSAARAEIPGFPVAPPSGPEALKQTDAWLATIHQRAEQGDWLIVRGTHLGDQVVAAATLGWLTHAAVFDKDKNEVIEAVANGVVVTPLRDLIASVHRVLIVRPPRKSTDEGKAAVARARSRMGLGYDWTGLIGAQRDARFYCTELAVDAYRGRERGWKIGRIILPTQMPKLGTIVFDSGPRAAPLPLPSRFARKLPGAQGVSYAAEVAPGLLRGGQPDEVGVAWLKAHGVRTVINLRHFHGDTERRRVESAGLRYERLKMASTDAPGPEAVQEFLRLVRDPTLRPLYVHCLHGVDRTGTMLAVYRMEVEGWTNAEAFAEMEYFEAHRILRDLRNFVRRYVPGTFRASK